MLRVFLPGGSVLLQITAQKRVFGQRSAKRPRSTAKGIIVHQSAAPDCPFDGDVQQTTAYDSDIQLCAASGTVPAPEKQSVSPGTSVENTAKGT